MAECGLRQRPEGIGVQHGIRHPARLVPAGFLAIIALGTALLMLPLSRAAEGAAPFMTALFTAVSATCVTGLAVVDTPTYWSSFGQGVILLLFQVGGFGIMTGASLLGLLVCMLSVAAGWRAGAGGGHAGTDGGFHEVPGRSLVQGGERGKHQG